MTDEINVKPIFLFCLPRAGSTLVQRVLASHDDIATIAEPWILLPFLYSLRKEGIYTEYGHWVAHTAVQDFVAELPRGEEDFLSELNRFVTRLYCKVQGKEAAYFLDKTPRYHLVVEDIFRLFPDAKFIFLWRNPLAVAASIIETWGRGNWILHRFKVDLFKGLANLVSAWENHADQVLAVRYEALIASPEAECRRVFDYLGLPFNPAQLTRFADVKLAGRMGDQTGVEFYREISREPLEKWKGVFTDPFRKAWARRYLRWIGEERLNAMGYDPCVLLDELDSVPIRRYVPGLDLLRFVWGAGYGIVEPRILNSKIRGVFDWRADIATR